MRRNLGRTPPPLKAVSCMHSASPSCLFQARTRSSAPPLFTLSNAHVYHRPGVSRRLLASASKPPGPSSDSAHNVDASNSTSPFQSRTTSEASSSTDLNTSLPRLIDTLQARLLTASQTLNDLTGYTSIESIKTQNERLESSVSQAHNTLRAARTAYKTATADRAATQRETTTLLARKESWTPHDLERFTELYRRDHTLEQQVASASESLNEAEAEEQRLSQALMAGMLRRYHEEQIWSDRIRRASTWGTWGLMGVNVVLFVLLQFVAEPWRRRRLVGAVVEEEKGVLDSVRSELIALRETFTAATTPDESAQLLKGREDGDADPAQPIAPSQDSTAEPLEEETTSSWTAGRPFELAAWKERATDLYSDRTIHMRMRDASILALQGALTGAFIASGAALLFIRR